MAAENRYVAFQQLCTSIVEFQLPIPLFQRARPSKAEIFVITLTNFVVMFKIGTPFVESGLIFRVYCSIHEISYISTLLRNFTCLYRKLNIAYLPNIENWPQESINYPIWFILPSGQSYCEVLCRMYVNTLDRKAQTWLKLKQLYSLKALRLNQNSFCIQAKF